MSGVETPVTTGGASVAVVDNDEQFRDALAFPSSTLPAFE